MVKQKPSNYNSFPVEKSSIDLSDPSQPESNNITPLSEQPLSVNMEYLSEIMSCDEELKRELVELYLRQTTEDLGKLKEALCNARQRGSKTACTPYDWWECGMRHDNSC